MNPLSWLLYLADISQSIQILCLISAVILCLYLLIAGILLTENINILNLFKNLLKAFVPILILAIFLPSKKTIYLIAASEMGEEVIKSEATEKVFDYLEGLLEDQQTE